MNLVKRNARQSPAVRGLRTPLSSFFEDIDPLLSRVLRTDLFEQLPAANIKENDNEYLIELAAPGLSKKDFHLNIENDNLIISAEKEEEKKNEEENYTRREYNYQSFSRSFNLPLTVQSDKIEAKYEDGILRLRLPKKEEAKKQQARKEIQVS